MIHSKEGTLEEQLLLEKEVYNTTKSSQIRKLSTSFQNGNIVNTPVGKVLITLGYDLMLNKVNEYLEMDLKTDKKQIRNLLLMFTTDREKMAYITIISILSNIGKSVPYISRNIIRALSNEHLFTTLKEDNPKLHTYLGMEYKRAGRFDKKRIIIRRIKEILNDIEYDGKESLKSGTTLIDVYIKSGANIVEKALVSSGGKQKYVIKFTEEAYSIIESIDYKHLVDINLGYAPIVIPPNDWVSHKKGGYYSLYTSLYNTMSKDVQIFLKNTKKFDFLRPLNKLQKTPYRINNSILELIDYIYNNNVLDPKDNFIVPRLIGGLPNNTTKEFDLVWEEYKSTPKAFFDYKDELEAANTKERSRRLALLMALSTAKKYVKYSSIYQAYQLDYRGRVYVMSSHLSSQGPNWMKALFEFSKGEYLTPDGYYWLKVHTANVYGLDKQPYNERVKWVEDNLQSILNTADSPLEHTSFWAWCDSPFEFVASCISIANHINGEKVYTPIQLDATCSGLQMYSGLLRDREGAKTVNVIGSSREDIYQMVADKVNYYIDNNDYPLKFDSFDKEGNLIVTFTSKEAKSIKGKINRKIVKRPVMTTPYSVTVKGMSNQIWDIMDTMKDDNQVFWEGEDWVVNRLITELTHKAIQEVVTGSTKGQNYLVEISKQLDEPATWYSPIYGFPIRQTVLADREERVTTVLGKLLVKVESDKVNKQKQANSIAPNFIHSIDSTILLYVIDNISCDISVIHDCFLVHPNNGYEVQNLYKEAFIEVMKTDPLRLVQQQLDPEEIVKFPEYGELDLEEVKQSKYIIS